MDKEIQHLLASIVESSQDSIVTIDLNRVITSWNNGAEKLYGYSAREVIGQPLAMIMYPEDIEGLIRKVNDIIHEITVPIYDTIRFHKNGRAFDLEIFLSPVRDDDGLVVGVSTVARDVSMRKMQEKQKDDFIAVASHELKTPVTSIKAYIQILLEQLEVSKTDAALSLAHKLDGQIDKLIALIGSLLDTTKLAAGEFLLNRELFDLNKLIEEQIETFEIVSDKHYFTFKPGTIKSVYADRKLIGQVISNIISNIYKYTPVNTEIIISSNDTENGVEVSVQDFGAGIPANVKEKIFERYFRASDQSIMASPGVGLGLYITAGIIQQHGGTINVQSEDGKGATFFFTLPYENGVS